MCTCASLPPLPIREDRLPGRKRSKMRNLPTASLQRHQLDTRDKPEGSMGTSSNTGDARKLEREASLERKQATLPTQPFIFCVYLTVASISYLGMSGGRATEQPPMCTPPHPATEWCQSRSPLQFVWFRAALGYIGTRIESASYSIKELN